jgi:hypothetical protein
MLAKVDEDGEASEDEHGGDDKEVSQGRKTKKSRK